MATTSEASRLQSLGHGMRFVVLTVGLLAVFGFTGCGVGVDDLDGQQVAYGQQQAAAQSDQALVGLDGTPAPSGDGTQQGAPAGSGPSNPGIQSLPTDPVPWQQPAPTEIVYPIDNPFGTPPLPPGGLPESMPGMK